MPNLPGGSDGGDAAVQPVRLFRLDSVHSPGLVGCPVPESPPLFLAVGYIPASRNIRVLALWFVRQCRRFGRGRAVGHGRRVFPPVRGPRAGSPTTRFLAALVRSVCFFFFLGRFRITPWYTVFFSQVFRGTPIYRGGSLIWSDLGRNNTLYGHLGRSLTLPGRHLIRRGFISP